MRQQDPVSGRGPLPLALNGREEGRGWGKREKKREKKEGKGQRRIAGGGDFEVTYMLSIMVMVYAASVCVAAGSGASWC